jgi:hypothetical protein
VDAFLVCRGILSSFFSGCVRCAHAREQSERQSRADFRRKAARAYSSFASLSISHFLTWVACHC